MQHNDEVDVVQAAGAPLAARELPALFDRVHAALASRRAQLDDLNVFPVPDGDTGTNMTLTIRAGVEALRAARREQRVRVPDELARIVIRGTVRGARGNSGVILSQVVRAVVEVVTGHDHVDAPLYAEALRRARALAYEAVADPVEGTILTAIAVAADAATQAVRDGQDLAATSAATCAATAAAVERTRTQLAVLREAEVVDAGARGFEILLAAVHGHLTGQDRSVVVDPPRGRPHETERRAPVVGRRYEVQYLLDADDGVAGPLRRRLEELGDSTVVVAAGGLLNVHVHTSRVGAVIDAGVEHGVPAGIRVVNLDQEVSAQDARLQARSSHPLGVVAVLRGSGLHALARDVGAAVVDGGTGALPSVADLVDAAVGLAGERILLLPGHHNAVAAALQAAGVLAGEHGREAAVVEEAMTPPAVLAALAVFDPAGAVTPQLTAMRQAAADVRSGQVVPASRASTTPFGPVRAGQPLAVADGRLVGAGGDVLATLEGLAGVLGVADAELVTVLLGEEADQSECDAAVALVRRLAPAADLEVVDADVRPARFWLGVQ